MGFWIQQIDLGECSVGLVTRRRCVALLVLAGVVLLVADWLLAQTGQTPPADPFGSAPFDPSYFDAPPLKETAPSLAPSLSSPPRSSSSAAGTPLSLDDGMSLNPELLADVQDDTLGLTEGDRKAYFAALALADSLPVDWLTTVAMDLQDYRKQLDERFVTKKTGRLKPFIDLFMNPQEYRGQAVTLQGHIRRLVAYDPGENPFGIEEVYEAWLYTDDSQSNPAVVVFLEKPEGLPLGGDLTEDISVTGYFLKMYGYDAQDTTRRAPLIVAKTVAWTPRRTINATPTVPVVVYIFVGGVALLMFSAIWQYNARERRRQRTHLRNYDQHPPGEFLPPEMTEPHDS